MSRWDDVDLTGEQTYGAEEGPYQQRAQEIYSELRRNVIENVHKVRPSPLSLSHCFVHGLGHVPAGARRGADVSVVRSGQLRREEGKNGQRG